MKKLLVIPNSLENLGDVLNTNVTGIILPIESLSSGFDVYFSLEDIRNIINLTSKEVCVMINKIIHNDDLDFLKHTLIKLNKMNVSKIFFYDLAVMNMCRKLNINKSMVVFQEHLNASLYSNNFYKDRGIEYSVITNDITFEEINEIGKHNKLMLMGFGYLPIFNSRRHLVSNYLYHIGEDKSDSIYSIRHNDDKYPVLEEDEGTTIYTREAINLINDIDNLNVDYIILNAFNIDNQEFMSILNKYINDIKSKKEEYTGFLHRRSVYRLEDYE